MFPAPCSVATRTLCSDSVENDLIFWRRTKKIPTIRCKARRYDRILFAWNSGTQIYEYVTRQCFVQANRLQIIVPGTLQLSPPFHKLLIVLHALGSSARVLFIFYLLPWEWTVCRLLISWEVLRLRQSPLRGIIETCNGKIKHRYWLLPYKLIARLRPTTVRVR